MHKHRKFSKWEDEVFNILTNRWVKFIHQHWVGNFVLDFFIPSRNLWIEVDWKDHQSKKLLDQKKTEYVNSLWINIFRVYNYKIYQNK
jgi:very-short-patch-repair endonuclease